MSEILEEVSGREDGLRAEDAGLEDLFNAISKYNPGFDRDLIARAYSFSASQHQGRFRKSGEDFIQHPLGTARICADLRLDSVTIAAALLHDVVEDTPTTITNIRKMFGDEVADLVDGLTKLQKVSLKSEEEEQVKSDKDGTERTVIAKGTYEVDDSEVLEKYSLPAGVKFAGLENKHTSGEVKEGIEFILFLQNGFVEKSVIHLQGSGDTVFSLEISPLTGNTRVHEEYTPFAQEEE